MAVEGGEHHGGPALGVYRIDGNATGHQTLDIGELADIGRLEERKFLGCWWCLLGGDGRGEDRKQADGENEHLHGFTIQIFLELGRTI